MGGYTLGFCDARAAAAKLCEGFAQDLDTRPEDARLAGITPREPVRRLRQAARRIANMEAPSGHKEADDVE